MTPFPIARSSVRRRMFSAALLSACASLAACASPMAHDFASTDDHYYNSLMARVVRDSMVKDPLPAPVALGGVHEQLARVDSTGYSSSNPVAIGIPIAQASGPALPLTPPAAVAPAATTTDAMPAPTPPPTTQEAEAAAGIPAAMLHQPEGPPLDLSLQDALHRAMDHSLAIKVEAYNPAIKESLIVQAEAAFDPVAFVNSNWSNIDEPLQQLGSLSNGQSFTNQFGVKQLLPTGATAQAATGFTYRDATIPPGGFNSLVFRTSYTSNINLQITQPLLRGFGTEVTEAAIYLARKDQRISLETFRRQVITTAADVEEAYDNLALAQSNVEILRRLVGASTQTYRTIWERQKIDADAANIAQALAALRSRQADLLVAEKNLRQASDRLKVLLNDPAIDIYSNVVLHATDKPIEEPINPDLVSTIDTALRQRTEIQEARLQVERSDIAVSVAKNNLLPKLDIMVSVQSNGFDNDLGTATSQNLDPGHFIDYVGSVKLEIPIGNREFEGQLTQRQLERRQAVTQMMRVALTVVTDVRLQMRELLSSYSEIEIRELNRQAAAAEFKGLVDKEPITKLTPEFLQVELDSQARLAQAEQAKVQAIVNYNLAIMRLEQSKGTLLEFDQISLDKPAANDPDIDLGKLRFLDLTYTKPPGS